MAEGSGLLNRRTGNTVPGVQIPPSPPVLSTKSPDFCLFWHSGLFFAFLPSLCSPKWSFMTASMRPAHRVRDNRSPMQAPVGRDKNVAFSYPHGEQELAFANYSAKAFKKLCLISCANYSRFFETASTGFIHFLKGEVNKLCFRGSMTSRAIGQMVG